HESLGFSPVGVYRSIGYKLGACHGVGLSQIVLQPIQTPPQPSTPLPQFAREIYRARFVLTDAWRVSGSRAPADRRPGDRQAPQGRRPACGATGSE
ncbi:MAG TPA: hypothetical protein VFJ58_07155, partial [Armatimonadota bacterium]|nr:hypothetical protein [Armatimonadota bacterium]